MTTIQNIWQGYHYVITDLADHRTKEWWLVESPGPILTILATYLFFCSYAGPNYMKDRKPYTLKYVMAVYNLLQVAFSIFLIYRGIEFIYTTNYRFKCHSIDYSENGLRGATSVWWYYMAKITELLDTVFFVLRKKNNQVSFLHLYHHTLMPLLSWFGTKYTPGGQAIAEGSINAFIHILMYGYYFVAGLGPQYQKYLWWKKYLTSLQLIQFCIVLYLNVIGLFAQNCNYPKYINLFVIVNCTAFLYMFGNFYYQSYVSKKAKRVQITKSKQDTIKNKDS